MKFIIFAILIFWSFIEAKKSISVENRKPKCPKGEIYQINGPGPFCYATCCGPRGPPCFFNSFTTGCFCKDPNTIKVFPVANNSLADPKNPCVKDCSKVNCTM
ncbi:hypothetical protein PVAND_001943 [Polypedilum vanderplanki]|uniref:Uncharacterized protein n=1 Tax=Polypedilum vanderplanki TaxID=319348 RepID=A0A9J6BPH7_POLVA|nr:hypothetical protein PVAND_001943 [Polypedilum vanderplanki]